MKKEHYPYLILAAAILILAAYGAVPKPTPEVSITISQVQFLNEDLNSPQIGVSIEWDTDIQPTYLTVDIQPVGAPETILPKDRDKYHLIRLPHKWVNTHTVFDYTGTFQQAYLIDAQGNRDFQVIVELKNDDITSEEYLARDKKLLSSGAEQVTTPTQPTPTPPTPTPPTK